MVYGMSSSPTIVCIVNCLIKNVCVCTEYILAVNGMLILCLWNIFTGMTP